MKTTAGKKKRGGAPPAPASDAAEPRKSDGNKRENFKFPERTAKELERISAESGITKTEVVRQGIALMRLCWDERKVGNRLVVQNAAGESIKEIVLP
jgi:hypothetical protein